MKLFLYVSYYLQVLADSDNASWLLVYVVTSLSIGASLLLLGSPNYFPI